MTASPPADPAAAAWWCLEMACPPELEESLLWKLRQLGVVRIALQHRPEAPHDRRLLAWLPAAEWSRSELERIGAALRPLGEPFGLEPPPLRWRHQPGEDWAENWKRHWQPDPVGERLLLLPAWLEPPASHAGRLVLRLDPGSAFGTGSHPSTRLCLEALEQRPLQQLRVADLGCGSGILSLAALQLGAAAAAACDTDGLAVRASRANAALNQLEGRLAVVEGSADALERLERQLWDGKADLLLCNILAPVIEALCPRFRHLLTTSGEGLLSGLLTEQAPALIGALAAEGWSAELQARQGPWGLLRIQRRAGVA